ncbi:MAG: DNA topoisomerase (ATP-hydrolyzing) subunit A [Gemmatimonas sp.]|uniref:DNA gyrase/topoisomerase IV subunit A n=1 Tax=Gemmatimonas sp. TaxID=1962908 RepID=UPI00391F05A9
MPPRTKSAPAPTPRRERVMPREVTDEMKASFINYSMSVITSRALPDVRDGLKPVNRRILYAMNELGLSPGRPFKKAATVVGDVLGKYHPHGDSSVYDALVRMVQDFSLRYPLIEGQGNFGSIDGDPAAAYRYTEARMAAPGVALLEGIDQDTVGFVPTFDDRLKEPAVLPAAIPNLLANGVSGIAVGMATNMPPHNLREIGKAIIRVIEEPTVALDELRKIVKGPDFPTAGLIVGKEGIRHYMETGRGRLINRARVVLEARPGSTRAQLVVTELPYQANKARIIEQIADLVKDEKLVGISALRDESDREGLRVVIELKRDAEPKKLLARLYKLTGLEVTFGVINLCLVPEHGRLVPRELGLRALIDHYVAHRHEVLVKRTEFQKAKAEARLHIVEGLLIAVNDIDRVVQLIKTAKDTEQAHARLRKEYTLSEIQADAILALRLAKLTGLEVTALKNEARELKARIKELAALLASPDKRMAALAVEVQETVDRFGDARRTEIVSLETADEVAETVADAEVVGVVTYGGRVLQQPLPSGRARKESAEGEREVPTDELPMVKGRLRQTESVFVLSHDGQAFTLFGSELPTAARSGRGTPLKDVIEWPKGGAPVLGAIVRDFNHPLFVTMVTATGQVKRTGIREFRNARLAGIKAIRLDAGDKLVGAAVTTGQDELLLATRHGQVIRFHESEVRDMGRDAGGVRGIALKDDDAVVSLAVVHGGQSVCAGTTLGHVKQVAVESIPLQGRGGQGVQLLTAAERVGAVVGVVTTGAEVGVRFLSGAGSTFEVDLDEAPVVSRATKASPQSAWPGLLTAVALVGTPAE